MNEQNFASRSKNLVGYFVPMSYMPETNTINQLQKSGIDFSLICYADLVPVLSGTRFWHHCTAPNQKLECT